MFSLKVNRIFPGVEDVPNDTHIVLLSHIVLMELVLLQTKTIPMSDLEITQWGFDN